MTTFTAAGLPEPCPGHVNQGQRPDVMLTISDIRRIFRLGKTAAYELTRRPDFPAAIPVSARCYRWWASEVEAYAEALRTRPRNRHRRTTPRASLPGAPPSRIIGTIRAGRAGGKL